MTQHAPPKAKSDEFSAMKPGDFPLRSAESRAAARAKVQALKAMEGPQPGDVHLDWSHYKKTPKQEMFFGLLAARSASRKPERIPGIPHLWVKLPDWFVIPEDTPTS